MKKKGQVTIFIIIAVVIIFLGVAFFIVKGNVSKEKTISTEETLISQHVMSCLEGSLEEVLFINGLQGGYYYLPKDSLAHFFDNLPLNSSIPYYLSEGKSYVPSKEVFEEQLSLGVEDKFKECLNFSKFPTSEISYSFEDLRINHFIEDKKIKLEVKFPISVEAPVSSFLLGDFKTEVLSNYLDFYKVSRELTKEQISHLDDFCVSCVYDLSEDYNLTISTTEIAGDFEYIIIYYLAKENSEGEIIELFSFTHKLKMEEI